MSNGQTTCEWEHSLHLAPAIPSHPRTIHPLEIAERGKNCPRIFFAGGCPLKTPPVPPLYPKRASQVCILTGVYLKQVFITSSLVVLQFRAPPMMYTLLLTAVAAAASVRRRGHREARTSHTVSPPNYALPPDKRRPPRCHNGWWLHSSMGGRGSTLGTRFVHMHGWCMVVGVRGLGVVRG